MKKIMISLCIGIGNYQDKSLNNVEYCSHSAKQVFALLTDERFGFCKSEYSCCITGEDQCIVTKRAVEDKLAEIASKIIKIKEYYKGNDVEYSFLFFFSGHGKVNRDDDLLLLMSDYSEINNVTSGIYSCNEIIIKLKESIIDHVDEIAIIIDSCRSEAVFNSIKHCTNNKIGYMWSCAVEQESQQSIELKQTFFSYYFCESIKEWSRNEGVRLDFLANRINSKLLIKHSTIQNQKAGYGGKQDILIAKQEALHDIPFTNRQAEIDIITSKRSQNTMCQIIDAPAEYGKTVLLQEINNRLKENKHMCIQVSIKENNNKILLLNNILFSLNIEFIVNDVPNEKFYLMHIKNEILKKINQLKEGDILYFIIDFEGSRCDSVFQYLFQCLIPEIIKVIEYNENIKFIISGRYLSHDTELLSSIPEAKKICLLPFSYKVTRDTISSFNKKNKIRISPECISTAAAHLFFFSGGHPGCIAYLLRENGDCIMHSPNEFFTRKKINECMKYVVKIENDIINSFDKDINFRKNIQEFSIFRKADHEAVIKYFNFSCIEKNIFIEKIIRTYLFKNGKVFIQDDIIRKIMLLSFQNRDINLFTKRCKDVQNICIERIGCCDYAHDWVIEYLFQIFQEFAFERIENDGKIEKFKEKILKEIVPHILNLYINREKVKYDIYRDKNSIEISLAEDEELRFIVNYSLRDRDDLGKYYSEEPFKQLKKEILDFFSTVEMQNE